MIYTVATHEQIRQGYCFSATFERVSDLAIVTSCDHSEFSDSRYSITLNRETEGNMAHAVSSGSGAWHYI